MSEDWSHEADFSRGVMVEEGGIFLSEWTVGVAVVKETRRRLCRWRGGMRGTTDAAVECASVALAPSDDAASSECECCCLLANHHRRLSRRRGWHSPLPWALPRQRGSCCCCWAAADHLWRRHSAARRMLQETRWEERPCRVLVVRWCRVYTPNLGSVCYCPP